MNNNRSAKQILIERYGSECFIEKLHLRPSTEPREYKSKGQMQKMKQLTYHHILEKRKGRKGNSRKWSFIKCRKSCMVSSTKQRGTKTNE